MDPEQTHDQRPTATNFKVLRETPNAELWLIELRLCLAEVSPRNTILEHIGNLGAYCEAQINLSTNPDESRKTLKIAIDNLLSENEPNTLLNKKYTCSLVLDLIRDFIPLSGFQWTAKLIDNLGMPEPEAPRVTGGEDTHLQALHALQSYFLKLPDLPKDGIVTDAHLKHIHVTEFIEMLPAYREILNKYASCGNNWYEGYAKRILGELSGQPSLQ